MQTRIRKVQFFLFILCLSSISCFAIDVPGYIITNDSDTIYGDVKIYLHGKYTSRFIFSGIDLGWYQDEVEFRTEIPEKFKTFKPEMISGFGFRYRSVDYIFSSFLLTSRSLSKKGRQKQSFLTLVHRGKLSVYRELHHLPNTHHDTRESNYDRRVVAHTYYNYYLYSRSLRTQNSFCSFGCRPNEPKTHRG